VPLVIAPLLRLVGASSNPYLSMFVETGVIVFLMVYAVMPYYTKLLWRWLFM
jgi:antibiotic biosynthesis monooxygenase (ABM) superfamily enzyme